MAELRLIVGEHPRYEDGDILSAYNRRRIRCVHADRICWPRVDGLKVGGLRAASLPLLHTLLAETSQYQWERVSRDEIKRTNLWTGSEIVYGSRPVEDPDRPGHMIHCHVAEMLARQHRAGKQPLFGSRGREIQYGGRHDTSHPRMDRVWAEIEARTAYREVDHGQWPATPNERRLFLNLEVDDFDDAEAGELTAPLVDDSDPENPVTLKKRKHGVDWRRGLGLSVADRESVLDFGREFDLRGRGAFQRAQVVARKQR